MKTLLIISNMTKPHEFHVPFNSIQMKTYVCHLHLSNTSLTYTYIPIVVAIIII